LTITVKIRGPVDLDQEAFDEQLLKYWKSEIEKGEIRFGGLTGIGRGRVKLISYVNIAGEVINVND